MISLAVAVSVAVLGLSTGASASPMFMGLGDLPGGTFNSLALGVSNDGTAVAGSSDVDGNGAFRWTEGTGMVALGDLPGAETDKVFEPGTVVNFESQSFSPRMSGITYYIDTLMFKRTLRICL